jgi:2-dehydro-3-deoxy-D-arabinonate dehydratase
MQLCRFHVPGQGAHLGVVVEGIVYDLTAGGGAHCGSLAALLQASVERPIRELIDEVELDGLPSWRLEELDRPPTEGTPHLLAPADQQEVWAAGVTYAWSREARVREALSKDIYIRVYEAERPELFFKCMAGKAVGPNQWIGLRGDSHWNVPEPEVTLVINPAMQIVGYTIGNDVSSRDIEGENPLYLPQAKMFRHGCSLGPVISLVNSDLDGRDIRIHLTVARNGASAYEGETATGQMQRRFSELVEYLGRYNDFPNGVLLLTGTGIVPDDSFTLKDGDEVAIELEGTGVLRNPVKQM